MGDGDRTAPHQPYWVRILAEGVVIVVSILLAFAIDAWWDDRGERRRTRASLEVLVSDLDRTIDQLREFEAFADAVGDASLGAATRLFRPVAPDERDDLTVRLARSLVRRTLRLPRAGQEDLMNDGTLRSIDSAPLRNRILNFYEQADRGEEIIEKNSQQMTDGFLNEVLVRSGRFLIRPLELDLNPVLSRAEAVAVEHLGPDFEYPPDPLWTLPRSSPEWDRIRSALLQNGYSAVLNQTIAEQLRASATALRDDIQAYLEDGVGRP